MAMMTNLGSWQEVVAPFCAPDDPNRPAVKGKGRKGLSVRRRWEAMCLVDKMGWRLWGPFLPYGELLVKLADGASLRGRRGFAHFCLFVKASKKKACHHIIFLWGPWLSRPRERPCGPRGASCRSDTDRERSWGGWGMANAVPKSINQRGC